MADKRKIKTRLEMIEDIKNIGRSIILNADDILGNEKYFLKSTVSFIITRDRDEMPTISVTKEFIPEGEIDDIKNLGKEKKK